MSAIEVNVGSQGNVGVVVGKQPNIGIAVGATGPRGPAGPAGPAGATGATGAPGLLNTVELTQAEFNALNPKVPNTIYVII